MVGAPVVQLCEQNHHLVRWTEIIPFCLQPDKCTWSRNVVGSCSFRHRFKTIDGTEMADVEQTQKMIPFITCKFSLGQHVCEWFFGVNVFDLDFGVQIDSIAQPIKSNSVGSGNMSHCRSPSLYSHLDHCFVVFKHIQQSFCMRRLDI